MLLTFTIHNCPHQASEKLRFCVTRQSYKPLWLFHAEPLLAHWFAGSGGFFWVYEIDKTSLLFLHHKSRKLLMECKTRKIGLRLTLLLTAQNQFSHEPVQFRMCLLPLMVSVLSQIDPYILSWTWKAMHPCNTYLVFVFLTFYFVSFWWKLFCGLKDQQAVQSFSCFSKSK